MEDFISQLSDEDLFCIVRGEGMGSPKVTPGTAAAFGGVTDSLKSFGIACGCCADGPSGIRMDCGTQAFSIPNGTCIACTFNEKLVQELFEMLGLELRQNKIDTILGPGMNIHRNPLNGRNFEYFSEDPYLTGKLAAAELKGMHKYGVTGTIKHFAANNQEHNRTKYNSQVSERALREIYLKGFEIAVRESQPGTIMTSYNCINGRHSSENKELLEHIVRGEWGFEGLFMTDWGYQSYKPSDMHAGNDLIMGGLQVEYFESALYGTDPVFTEDGSVDEIVNMAYGGMMRQAVENWGAFLPQAGGKDSYTVTVAARTELGERAQKRVEEGSATVTENADGTKTVTYHGIKRGRHLPLGDVQRCAMDVLKYLMSSLAWDDMMASMEEQEKA